jgi:ribosomal protein L20
LKGLHVELDRKVLADLAVTAPQSFTALVQKVREAVT